MSVGNGPGVRRTSSSRTEKTDGVVYQWMNSRLEFWCPERELRKCRGTGVDHEVYVNDLTGLTVLGLSRDRRWSTEEFHTTILFSYSKL